MYWLNKPYRLWSSIAEWTSVDSCPEALLSVNCSVTEVAVDSAEYNTKWFCAYSSFLNLPSCCFVPLQFCSPHKSCSNVLPQKVFALFLIHILQHRMASEFGIIYGNFCRQKPNFLTTWSTIQTCLVQIRVNSQDCRELSSYINLWRLSFR